MNKQRKIAIGIMILIVIIGGIVLLLVTRQNSSQSLLKDRDTGETRSLESSEKTHTGGGLDTDSSPILFGVEPLVKLIRDSSHGETGNLITTTKAALAAYNSDRLDNTFQSLTLRPQGLQVTDSQLTGFVRLGQSDEIVPIKITYTQDRKGVIVTINSGGSSHGGSFVYVGGLDSQGTLLFTITQKDNKSTDLVIKTFAGYRTIALKYLESIGYHPSDFSITFTVNENPFK